MKNRLSILAFAACVIAAGEQGPRQSFGELPLAFEPNMGQVDSSVRYLARVPGFLLYITGEEAVFQPKGGDIERMKWLGASRPRFEPLEKQPGISNYFIGNDPAKWRTEIPNYGRVALRGVYPGIDLVFYGNPQRLEYDWIVAPGADPSRIRVRWEGRPVLMSDGSLSISKGLRQQKAEVRQEGKAVAVSYAVRGREVVFELARYDRSRPLVIDPVLLYQTFNGSGLIGTDIDRGFALDGGGNAYACGNTASLAFPVTVGALQASMRGTSDDFFVTKLNPTGTARLYSTYLGGTDTEFASLDPTSTVTDGSSIGTFQTKCAIAADRNGNAILTGATASSDYPTVAAFRSAPPGMGHLSMNNEAVVSKLNPTGSALVYSTYLGGSSYDVGWKIAVDTAGSAYVFGNTKSTDFPVSATALQRSPRSAISMFVTKVTSAGAIAYSTYMGGTAPGGERSPGVDEIGGIAVDTLGNAYITGATSSRDFPTLNAYQPSLSGGVDAFVAKLNPAGSDLVYSTFLGGTASDIAYAIAVDGGGSAYIAGATTSVDYPLANALISHTSAFQNGVVTKLSPSGRAMLFSTLLGGSAKTFANGIAVDRGGNIYVTGGSNAADLPQVNPMQPRLTIAAADSAFVTKYSPFGRGYLFSTYFGGQDAAEIRGIGVNDSGNVYLGGSTGRTGFLATPGAVQTTYAEPYFTAISGNPAVAAYLDGNSIRLSWQLIPDLSTAPREYSGDPAVAQNAAGDTFVAAPSNDGERIAVNVFDSRTRSWDTPVMAPPARGVEFTGSPSVAVCGTRALVVARDRRGAAWSIVYTRGTGFAGWFSLGGSFRDTPSAAARQSGEVCAAYLAATDSGSRIWTGGYFPISSPFDAWSGWTLRGDRVLGKPAVTVGQDLAAYIVSRNTSAKVQMGRLPFSGGFEGWYDGGGSLLTDPKIASLPGEKLVVAAIIGGFAHVHRYTEGAGNRWDPAGWQSTGRPLQDVEVASSGIQYFLVGRSLVGAVGSPPGGLWWYESLDAGWKFRQGSFPRPIAAAAR
ncbi:MAG: SBBP repeat-containing protein [Bryobacteraceae bacterium]